MLWVPEGESTRMAKPNYSFQKRQRELAKQQKKQEKAAKKALARGEPPPPPIDEMK